MQPINKKQKLQEFHPKIRKIYMSLIRLIKKSYPARVIILVGLYYLVLQSGLLASVNSLFKYLTVVLSSSIMEAFGIEVTTIGDIIISEGKSLLIGYGCEGSEPVILFSLAIMALKGKWARKITYMLTGSAILYALNVGRVIGLMETIKLDESYLDLMHHNIFPMIIAGSVFGLWVFSIKKIGRG